MKQFNGARTYGDLIRLNKPSCQHGTCCACHRWDRPTWRLSTRANICRECCERKASEVLGPIQKAERKARRWIKGHPDLYDQVPFLVHLTGASAEFVEAEIAKAQRSAA